VNASFGEFQWSFVELWAGFETAHPSTDTFTDSGQSSLRNPVGPQGFKDGSKGRTRIYEKSPSLLAIPGQYTEKRTDAAPERDSELGRVLEAWPRLPAALKAAVLAIVGSVNPDSFEKGGAR
jgi:hypothetical protein